MVILFFLGLPVGLLAQKDILRFERIQVVQQQWLGSVFSLQQDSRGFMWFGSRDGLYKYDGYSLTAYKHDRFDSTSLGNNLIFSLYEDHRGTLWIGTAGGGLNRFDRDREGFVRFAPVFNDSLTLDADVVWSICEDRGGTLWVGTWAGLNMFDRDTGKAIRVLYSPEPKSPITPDSYGVLSIFEDRAGTLWVGTDGRGLYRRDRKTREFRRFLHDPGNVHSLSSNVVASIYEDRTGVLWIGTDKGLNRFDRRRETFTRFVHDPENPHSLSDNNVSCILEDSASRSTLWIGTDHGLNRFDPEREQFTRFVHDSQDPHSLSNNEVLSIFKDRTGTLWIGTGDGVNRLDRGLQRFAHFSHDPQNPQSLSSDYVMSLHEDSTGTLWVGTLGGGLNQVDRDSGRFRHFVHDPEDSLSLSHNTVRTIHEDRFSKLWIGTWGGGLNRFDRDSGKFDRFVHDPEDPHSLSANNVWSILEDRAGTLWIGTEPGGLNRFDRKRERFVRLIHDPENPRSLPDDLVTSIFESRSGKLWLGTGGGGISQYDPVDEQFSHFGHDPNNPRSVSHGWIGVVFEDFAGTLWASAWYAGLNKLEDKTGMFTLYSERDGLPSNQVLSVAEDNRGYLWLGTLNGLSRFDPKNETFKNFDVDDGLINRSYSWNAVVKSRTGEFFLGGTNGIDFFHPDSIKDNPHIPPVVITRLLRYNSGDASGTPVREKGLSEKHELELSYKDRILTFEFAALDFRRPRRNQYAYKLEGFNHDWIHLGNKHDITFTDLGPGKYTLRVKGSNNDGIWNEVGTSLRITILPPWWRTRWAYAAYFLILLAALYGIRYYELRRVRLRNALKLKNVEAEKLQELDRLKTRFFTSISHEFRTPLTLILGLVQKWLGGLQQSEMKADFRIVKRNARRLQQLIDQLLDLSKLEAGKMHLQARPENLVVLLRMITMTFEALAKQKGINLQFLASEDEIIAYVDRDKLEKIVTNLLSNAFKSMQDRGKVAVAVGKNEQHSANVTPSGLAEIRVSDTGIGIPKDQLEKVFDRFHQADNNLTQNGTGIGLALTKELVALHRGTIEVRSEPELGTRFTVRLPLGHTHLKDEEIVQAEFGSVHQVPGTLVSEDYDIHDPEESVSILDSHTVGHMNGNSKGNEVLLIVEDNPDMRAFIRSYLEPFYHIVEAENGSQGLKQAHEHGADLIISDLMMPEMDGFELCKELKTNFRTSHIPVILLTARASMRSKVEGLETGADDYLTKPFDAQELQVRVKNLIEQRRRLHERFRRELLIQPSEVTVTSMDAVFLQKVMDAVEAHIDDPSFDTDDLARESGLGRRQLNRKLRALTGQSVRKFIRTVRLKRAAHLLQRHAGTVTEIAYDVGFNSLSHFAKIFREQFGVAPSDFSHSRSSQESEG